MDAWRAMVRAQGGDPDAPLPTAREVEEVRAERDGVVRDRRVRRIGVAAWRLGAGRARKEDPVSASAGVVLQRRPGDRVRAGDVLYELRAEHAERIPAALAAIDGAFELGPVGHGRDGSPASAPLVRERIA